MKSKQKTHRDNIEKEQRRVNICVACERDSVLCTLSQKEPQSLIRRQKNVRAMLVQKMDKKVIDFLFTIQIYCEDSTEIKNKD